MKNIKALFIKRIIESGFLKTLILLISFFSFSLLLFGRFYEILFYLIVSIIFTILIKDRLVFLYTHKFIEHCLSALISVIVIAFQFLYFVSHLSSISLVSDLLNAIKLNINITLNAVGIILSVFSFFSIYCITRILIFSFIKIVKWIFSRDKIKKIINAHFLKITLASLIIIIISSFVGLCLLYAVYLIPSDYIYENYTESTPIVEAGSGAFFTDGIMLDSAAHESEYSTLEKCIMVYHGTIDNYDNCFDKSYSRYWHGYLVFLKPLLCLFNYSGIRVFNLISQVVCVAVIALLLWAKKEKKLIIPIIIIYLLLLPKDLILNMAFQPCLYIMFLGIVLVLINKNNKLLPYAFLILGILTSYFDFLTFPLITLGIPLLILLYFHIKNGVTSDNLIVLLLHLSFFWVLGYAGMWAMKWILGSIILNRNLISNALSSILLRTSSAYNSAQYSRIAVVFTNIFRYFYSPAVVLFFAFLFFKFDSIHSFVNSKYIPLYLVDLELIGWYMIAANHSQIHFYFTNRSSAIFAFSIMICSLLIGYNRKPFIGVLNRFKNKKNNKDFSS